MASISHIFLLLPLACSILGSMTGISAIEDSQTYIIHMDHSHKPSAFSTHHTWYKSMLASLSSSHDGRHILDVENMLLYTYNHAMHGFSARLTPTQLSQIQKHPAYLTTYPDSYGKLFTTYTPKYLGLNRNSGLWPAASYGQDVIIGVLDSGIWPESESFRDHGMAPVPERWKGECEKGTKFNSSNCNRKLIGARSFKKGLIAIGRNISTYYDYDSARDFLGHGTHTSSTAAGAVVDGVDHFGYARGTSQGIAPAARIAMYKIGFLGDTFLSMTTDVLAGMDQAIADGVDVMSLSLGFDHSPYFKDVIAIGALAAVEKGIFVSCSAGNAGVPHSIFNGAPWITTVGAGTVDRNFVASVTLGDGNLTVEGTSYFPQRILINRLTLYYGKGNESKASCISLDPDEVFGNVVFCDASNVTNVVLQIEEANRVGAIAGIFEGNPILLSPSDYSFPSVILEGDAATQLREYAMNNDDINLDMDFIITRFGLKSAPQVAQFSSRGPDPVTPSLLKPDILAPGVDVLAAWAPITSVAQEGRYALITDYALLSGTSMSAPHVAGVAALLRAVHPEWSPAAIRSAMMTTARTVDDTGSPIRDQATGLPCTPLEFGAGHINPNKAMDPGLVYDLEFQDYISFICSLGYNASEMSALIRSSTWVCPDSPSELNYPSFIAIFSSSSHLIQRNFTRVLTNVGGDAAVYRATVEVPKGIQIQVKPDSLTFSSKNQKLEFVLNIEVDKEVWSGANNVSYGYLRWVDQHMAYVVSSPIVIMAT